MENLHNKNLAELFDIGIKLDKSKHKDFIEEIKQISPKLAAELKKMLASNPSQMGLSGAINNLKTSNNPVNALEMPKTIGKFTITNILGFGGMGMVFLGRREDINQVVAVKVAHSSKADTAKTQAITSEAKILASLQHPNIASLVDWGEFENGHYIATEYVDGTTIGTYCDEHKLGIKQRIELLMKIVDAVEFAHDNLIIHRDIKPNNIMVDEAGEPILIDFGIARLMESETAELQQTQNAALTPSFASPEQRTGKSLSIRSDIYSLGAVLLNLIIGKQLDNQKEHSLLPIIEKMINEDYQHNKSKWHKISKPMRIDLSMILAKGLSYDPKQRYANAFSFKKDLQALLSLKPITAHEPSKWYWFKKFMARNKLVSSIATVAILAMVFGGWQWYLTEKQKSNMVKLNDEYFNYSRLLTKTLYGMDAFEGGRNDLTMEDFMEKAVEIFKKEKKASPKLLSHHALVLANIYSSWGNYKKSLNILELGIKLAKKSKNLSSQIILLGQKAIDSMNIKNYKVCIETSNKIISIEKIFKNNKPKTISALTLIAQCYSKMDNYKKSIEINKRILTDKTSTKRNISQAYFGLGMAQTSLYQFERALKNYKKAKELFIEVYGENTGMVINAQGIISYHQAQINPVLFDMKQFDKTVNLAVKVFGEKHQNTLEFMRMKGEAHFLKGELTQAIKLQDSILLLLKNTQFKGSIIKNKLYLINYHLYKNNIKSAISLINSIDEQYIEKEADNYKKSLYFNNKTWLCLLTGNLVESNEITNKIVKLIKGTNNLEVKVPLYFRIAQLAAIEKNYQSCHDNSLKATNMATKLYPKTWQLPNAYRYLQDVCQQKLEGTKNQGFPYLQAVLDSPWKQETVITTKILNSQ